MIAKSWDRKTKQGYSERSSGGLICGRCLPATSLICCPKNVFEIEWGEIDWHLCRVRRYIRAFELFVCGSERLGETSHPANITDGDVPVY